MRDILIGIFRPYSTELTFKQIADGKRERLMSCAPREAHHISLILDAL
jgi:hypothetical protein